MTNLIFNNKTKISFGTSVTENEISCHRKYRFIGFNAKQLQTLNILTTQMAHTSTNNLDKKVEFLSGYQMLGGLIGLAYMLYILFQSNQISLIYILVLGLGILLYVFSFMCGVFLFQRKTYGVKLSLINQILQIIGFSFFGYGFEYVAGLSFDIFLKFTDGVDFTSNFGLSNWHILINNDTGIKELSINVLAIFLILFLLKLQKEYNLEMSDITTPTIGAK